MSMDSTFPSDPPAPKTGGSKLLLGLGIGCGVALLLCCGGVGVMIWFGGQMMAGAVKEDPAEVKSIALGIAEMDIPPELVPKTAIDMKLPIINQRVMTMALYEGPDVGSLLLAQFPGNLGNVNQQQMEQQLQQSLKQQGRGQQELDISESRTIEMQIRGQPATFTIAKGTASPSGEEFYRATGTFAGKGGVAMLILQLRADRFSEEQVERIVQSVK